MECIGEGVWRAVKGAVLRTGRIMDTSPPIWELRSARARRNVYKRELVLDERFCFATEFPCVLAFTFVNGKTSLGAPGVNVLLYKRFRKTVATAPLAGIC